MADLDNDAGDGPSPELSAALDRLIDGTALLSHKIGMVAEAASPMLTYHALASAVAINADALVDMLNETPELADGPAVLMRDAMLPAAEVLERAASKFREAHVLLVKRINDGAVRQ